MQFNLNPTPQDRPSWKEKGYGSPIEKAAEARLDLTTEETVEALREGAPRVIEKDPVFAKVVDDLLRQYKHSWLIPLEVCKKVVGEKGRQPEMVIAVAEILEERIDTEIKKQTH